MSQPFVAEIRIVGFNFPPRGWAFCNGQILPLSQNTALFSLLGTTYGGDGRSTFALPNLQGSVPIQQGQGPGLTDRILGEVGGSENVTLLQSEMPQHTHSAVADGSGGGNQSAPNGNAWSSLSGRTPPSLYNNAANTTMSPFAVGITGSSFPHNNMQPYLALNFIIALQGVFPARN
ncbi:tail fiber protein [Tabrizicola sp.]|uniref:phage tail protein n=1 Tax=Tabrizicola sp. TaxID=2005166 RepID=UPI00286CEE8C|nr:tail fiber protein [Tabrizicola sp.]